LTCCERKQEAEARPLADAKARALAEAEVREKDARIKVRLPSVSWRSISRQKPMLDTDPSTQSMW